jgi:hypothetical protein
MPQTAVDLVIDVFAREVLDLEDELAATRELLSAALTNAQAATVRHQALVGRFEELREELRRYVRSQVKKAMVTT